MLRPRHHSLHDRTHARTHYDEGHPGLWNLFGDLWAQPRYYSLILQPFLVSPAINVGDVAVAMCTHPHLSLEAAMRQMHPFPIFERWVEDDVVVRGKVAVKAGTQVREMQPRTRGLKPPEFERASKGYRRFITRLQTFRIRLQRSPVYRCQIWSLYSEITLACVLGSILQVFG